MRQEVADTLIQQVLPDSASGVPGTHASFSVWRIVQSMPGATPSQLDSAIQANLPPRERFLSTRPDTLNLPGLRGRSLIPHPDSLDKCYKLGFFSHHPWLHPELVVDTPGFSAEPRPYELRSDEWVTGVLLLCFLFTAFFVRHIWRFLTLRTKEFLNVLSFDASSMSEVRTSLEKHYSFFMTGILSLMYALAFYGYTQSTLEVFLGQLSPYTLIGFYIVFILSYFGIKSVLYTVVNAVFFDKVKRMKWNNAYSYLIFAETVLLFPLLMVLVYFDISGQKSIYFILFLIFFVKTLLLLKCYRILFQEVHCLLHFFVYLCALEAVPLVVILTTLSQITDSLIAIF